MKVKIKTKSRVPGVMITQYVEVLPDGMSTPDFTRKPIGLTIQEGKIFLRFHFLWIVDVTIKDLISFIYMCRKNCLFQGNSHR